MTDTADVELFSEVSNLLAKSGHVVILERIARGGGATRWHYCCTLSEVRDVVKSMRPGSQVGFFFDDRIRRRSFSEDIAAEILDIASAVGEVCIGRATGAGNEYTMDLVGVEEAMSVTTGLKTGEVVLFGAFPSIEDDHIHSITFIPPDLDGVIRPQPS